MKASRSFDQAAEVYDQTRPLFDSIADAGIQSLLDVAGEGARILEVGTGTGRISIPLLKWGGDLIGCDLSPKMLARQHEKYPAARLLQADAVFLPFPDDHFDILLTVHVMHLIGPWREALREFKRVLKAGGAFLGVRTTEVVGESFRWQIREYWRNWIKDQGVDAGHPGVRSSEEIRGELRSLGARLEEMEVVRYSHPYTLRAELERFENRISSDTWPVPEPIYQASLEALRDWVAHEFDDLDQEREEQVRFVYDIARFET